MIGPGWFGYVDVDGFWYGEKGGRFLNEWAHVFQEPHTPTGKKRLPVWSELDTDDIVVACPSDVAFRTVEDSNNENLVWVHKISRDPEHWRHDVHPMQPTSLRRMLSLPLLDEKDGTTKVWQVSETSAAVRKLLEMGKIGRTTDGAYYLIDPNPIVLRDGLP